MTHSAEPASLDRISGVRPSSAAAIAFGLTPPSTRVSSFFSSPALLHSMSFSSNTLKTAGFSFFCANANPVSPSEDLAVASAPASMRTFTQSACPPAHANRNGVMAPAPATFTAAPLAMSDFITAKQPFLAVSMRAVIPPESAVEISASRSRRKLAQSTLAAAQASIRAVLEVSETAALMSTPTSRYLATFLCCPFVASLIIVSSNAWMTSSFSPDFAKSNPVLPSASAAVISQL